MDHVIATRSDCRAGSAASYDALFAGSFTHPPRLSAQPASVGELDAAFTQAAAEFDIPRDLLVTVAYAETRFDDHDGQPSIDNGYGLMHLVDNPEVQTLPLAARLLGVDAEQLKHDVVLNIRGGAAILPRVRRRTGPYHRGS
jgi:soluble lytic murein transglycosylase-like protein